jgi:uncharacterized protein (DUF2267 family)
MKFDQFVGEVQSRARLGSMGEAVGAIRATLETLGERITAYESKDLASQLPREIGYFLFRGAIGYTGQRIGYQEFVDRVAFREFVDRPAAAYHSRVVMEVASEAVSLGEMQDVVVQLPDEFEPLFAGSTGAARIGDRVGRRSGGEDKEMMASTAEGRGNQKPRARTKAASASKTRSQRQNTGKRKEAVRT